MLNCHVAEEASVIPQTAVFPRVKSREFPRDQFMRKPAIGFELANKSKTGSAIRRSAVR
jgi:hypothetical protein